MNHILCRFWDDHIVWESIAQTNTDLLGVNVKVFDADMVTKEALGQVTLPVKDFPDGVGEVADNWYTLELFGKMKTVSGSINVAIVKDELHICAPESRSL